jgi:glutaconate CoA-transferase, subunit B
MNFTPAELMALVCARALRDGDVIVTGTRATLPSAAYRSAQLLGKPHIRAMIGATGTIDPSVQPVPLSGGDQAFLDGRVTLDLVTGVRDQLRGLVDVIFLGALQLDGSGRCNLAVVGDYRRPRLRGPGSIGLSMVGSVKRTIMFFERHDPRVLVERVDFVSGDILRNGGELLVVTPLAVLGSRAGQNGVQLLSMHAGVDFEDLQTRTGFFLDRKQAVITAPPTRTELTALRSLPDGRALASLLPA